MSPRRAWSASGRRASSRSSGRRAGPRRRPWSPSRPGPSLLEIRDLEVAYGGLPALSSVSLRVEAGEFVALVGANGAGKSTLLRSVAGLVRPRAGTIRWREEDLTTLSPDRVVDRGIALVPEGRKLFGQMTV